MKTMLRIVPAVVLSFLISAWLTGNNVQANPLPKKDKAKFSGWLGVQVQDVTEKIVKKLKLPSDEGAYVAEVVENSPADSAGVKEHDVIVEFNGRKVFDTEDLTKAVQRSSPGTKVTLLLVRDGEKKTFSFAIGKKKMMKHRMGMIPPIPDVHMIIGNRILGLQLLTLNEQLGEYFGAPNNEGVLVQEVEKESAAASAGIKAGDVITRVGKKLVTEVEKIRKEFEKYDEGDKVEIEVVRKGVKKVLTLEMEEGITPQKNFFFHGPRLRMFPHGHIDDSNIQLEIEELQPDVDQAQGMLEEATREIENKSVILQNRLRSSVESPYGLVEL